ncbi:MAG: 16S rRNA (adenine(1518)-N(6)/adenine(1519)-N(6))-dimethyltransferase RsmA [Chitinophagaceae bacterium]
MYTLKKSLGQHFLTDENIAKNIVDELQKHPFQRLLEVGPGGGALTKYILQIKDIEFKAVEIDDEKVRFLKSAFPEMKDKIISENMLDMEKPFDENFAVIGNFPYNISTQIVFKVIEWRSSVDCMIGMFQKEVAQRIAAKEGNKIYGVTSILTQAYFDVIYLFDVPQNSFNPPPKVMSGVIKLLPKETPLEFKSDQSLFTLVKAAFGQRRKTLRNAVKYLFAEDVWQKDIFTKRAEQLSVKEFAALTYLMK